MKHTAHSPKKRVQFIYPDPDQNTVTHHHTDSITHTNPFTDPNGDANPNQNADAHHHPHPIQDTNGFQDLHTLENADRLPYLYANDYFHPVEDVHAERDGYVYEYGNFYTDSDINCNSPVLRKWVSWILCQ